MRAGLGALAAILLLGLSGRGDKDLHTVAKIDNITHQGEATGYVIFGSLELTIDGEVYRMNAGDSFFFKAYLPNSYRNVGKDTARIVWVNTPQIH